MRTKDIKYGGSVLALMVGCMAAPAFAQAPAADEIVVTGTNIRGAAPVGSNVIAVGREAIEETSAQTVQQILRSVPAITGLGATPQGGNPGNAVYQPTIHSLGSSSSNSTLVIVDGHRISPGSQQQTLVDPNIVPPIALERVEVLAEGASSIYGSDAVAGVVNFITRKNYDGTMITGQMGFADGYSTESAGALWGTNWDNGNVLLAYNYSHRSNLKTADRDFLNRDHTAQGGSNFGTFNCSPASIQPNGAGNIYPSATATTSLPSNTNPCQKVLVGDAIPEETRQNAMLKISRNLTDRLKVGVDAVYSVVENRTNTSRGNAGGVSAFNSAGTVGTGATAFTVGATQINPFYTNPPGVTATRQSVRWDADELLGPGAYNFQNATDYYVAGNAEYQLSDKFRLQFLALHGAEDSSNGGKGQLCGSCANLALNGTTNATGNTTTISIPGTNTIVLQPLTAANALDVWNPAATNRTSAATRARLIDNQNRSDWYYDMNQVRASLDGELFTLPAGPLRFAVGAEYVDYGLDIYRVRPNNTGPSSTGQEYFNLFLERDVKSAYIETVIPIISEDMNIPLVRKFELNLSDRVDQYSDTGDTENPRVGFGWEVYNGLRFRGNYAESFVAPQLTSYGDRSRGGLTSFSGYSNTSTSLVVPRSRFPLCEQVPGVTVTATTCTTNAVNGITQNGAPLDPQPGRGVGLNLGFDFAPPDTGLRISATYFTTKLINQITGTAVSNAINSDALKDNLQFFPAGMTPTDIANFTQGLPQSGNVTAPSYYAVSVRQQNVLNLDIRGIDATVDYEIPTETMGTFSVGGAISYFTKFDQKLKGGPWFSVLGSTGFNNTFPSIRTQARGSLGWEAGGFEIRGFANHVGEYHNWGANTIKPVTSNADGNPNGGGDVVEANTLFDLNVAYSFDSGMVKGTQVYMNVDNIADKEPVFYNSASGVDSYGGSILGRVISVGFRARF